MKYGHFSNCGVIQHEWNAWTVMQPVWAVHTDESWDCKRG